MENTTNKTPTALELLKSNHLLIENNKTCEAHTHLVVKQMIEFAKLHVQATLQAVANENPTFVIIDNGFVGIKEDNERILDAYPLDNIL